MLRSHGPGVVIERTRYSSDRRQAFAPTRSLPSAGVVGCRVITGAIQ